MGKIGFKLSTDNFCAPAKITQLCAKPYSSNYYKFTTRIVLRKDDDVKRSQVKGYKYLVP